jgi:hypothetical protein
MDSKRCPKCGITKPVAEFYKHHRNVVSGYCKPCCVIVQREWYANNRQRKSQINRTWRLNNSERRKAMNRACGALWRAIKRGEIVRGTICEQCASTQTIEACHDDYSQPLKVKWLCIRCHRLWDAQTPKTGNLP